MLKPFELFTFNQIAKKRMFLLKAISFLEWDSHNIYFQMLRQMFSESKVRTSRLMKVESQSAVTSIVFEVSIIRR